MFADIEVVHVGPADRPFPVAALLPPHFAALKLEKLLTIFDRRRGETHRQNDLVEGQVETSKESISSSRSKVKAGGSKQALKTQEFEKY